MSLNSVNLIGNITADPEVRMTGSGVAVCNFSLAVNRRFSKNGEQGQHTVDFLNIVTWRQQAEFVGRYVKKGASIYVSGSLQTRNFTNQQGQKVYVTEVVADDVGFAGSAAQTGNAGGQPRVSAPSTTGGGKPYVPNAYGGNAAGFQPIEVADDDTLPF